MVIQPNIPNDNRVLWLNRNNASYYNNGTSNAKSNNGFSKVTI